MNKENIAPPVLPPKIMLSKTVKEEIVPAIVVPFQPETLQAEQPVISPEGVRRAIVSQPFGVPTEGIE